MPGAFVTVNLDQGAISRIASAGGLAGQELVKRGNRVKNRAQQLAPVDRGTLRASITVSPIVNEGGALAVRVGTGVPYGLYVHEGTGLWGNGLIRPRSAKVLRWPAGKGGKGKGYVFSRYSRGSPPNHFLTDAIPAGAD